MPIEKFIEAGRITNTHGVSGDVKIEVWLDSPDFLKRCKRVFVDGKEYRFRSARQQNRFLIVSFEEIADVASAMPFKGKKVYIDRDDAPLKKGEFFLQDIIGIRVVDQNGGEVGVLREIFEAPASAVYVVQGESEHLIPAVPEFIMDTDVENGVLTVKLIEGM
ncbi:MAG: 16S rRNA processing protein RimM [Oscillospiraceae bacterium]|nr:16S rRNA processing protein RimM [Oscillospiraceae bacterium]